MIESVLARAAIGVTFLGMMHTMPVSASDGRVLRLGDGPIISTADERLEGNVNGPSLIRVPEWVEEPLGRYYLYFAHHKGTNIRLAYADHIEGPWTLYEPGALTLAESFFATESPNFEDLAPLLRARPERSREFLYPHIASPDVIVDEAAGHIRLYYHGLLEDGRQATRVATSRDGLQFEALPQVLGRPYFRAFKHNDIWYAMAMPGVFYRSSDGLRHFEEGPTLFESDMRHSALRLVGSTLQVFWTRVGDAPERILLSTVDLSGDWHEWEASEPVDVLRPEYTWEGSDLPLVPSQRGASMTPVNQLRDPAFFEERERLFLLYSVAGEQGVAIAMLEDIDDD